MSIENELVVPLPAIGDPDAVVRRTVKALLAGAGMTAQDLGPHVRISTSTFYQRLKSDGPPFTGGEIWRIAEYFGVPVGALFDGRFLPPTGLCARLGSNQRPTAYLVAGHHAPHLQLLRAA